jgi:hypothetical protein
MPAGPVPPDVRRFIVEHIHSVAQLEVLLLLQRDPEVAWTAEEVGREMRYPAGWAATQLVDYCRERLVAEIPGEVSRYRYAPSPRLAGAVEALADLYPRRRTTVTQLIFSRGEDDVRLFSDAFRIRRPEEEDE